MTAEQVRQQIDDVVAARQREQVFIDKFLSAARQYENILHQLTPQEYLVGQYKKYYEQALKEYIESRKR